MLALLELALWGAGVSPAYHYRDPFAGFTPQVTHFQVDKDDAGQEIVTLVPSKKDVLNPQRFLSRKPSGVYRIVCLGGSAVYGRPFYDLTSFPGWLRALLPKADPSRKWEVINAGAISYASYRIKGLMAELARFEPDLFILYTGENEFLERRTYAEVFNTPAWLRNAAGLASRLRLATVTQRGLERVGFIKPAGSKKPTGIEENVHRIPVDLAGPDAYTRDETFHRQVLRHFEASLNAIADIAGQAKAGLLLITPVSNLRDFAPFKSENKTSLSPDELQRWKAAYDNGRSLMKQGRWEESSQAFDAALALDDRHAHLLYAKAQALLAQGKDAAAREYFARARDEDVCPLRALSATLEILRKVAAKRGAGLLDWDRTAGTVAEHGIPGGDLLCDHVHLQISASKRLALEILTRLTADKVVAPAPDWGPEAVARVADQIDRAIDRPRYTQELYNLSRLLELLNQPEQSLRRVEEGLKLAGGDVEGFCLAGHYADRLGKLKEAKNFYSQALARQPGAPCAEEGLGSMLLDQQKPREALAHLETAARTATPSSSLLNRLGVAHAQLGQHEQALKLFQQAIQLKPDDVTVLVNLARAEELLGDLVRALTHYREAIRLMPDNPQAAAGLQRLAAANGVSKQGG